MADYYDIHDEPEEDEHRFVIGHSGNSRLVFLGRCPSFGNSNRTDPTMNYIKRTAVGSNYDSHLLLNIYPQRIQSLGDFDQGLHRQNIEIIIKHINDGSHVWAAWDDLSRRPYLLHCRTHILWLLQKKSNLHWKVCFAGGLPALPDNVMNLFEYTPPYIRDDEKDYALKELDYRE